jgi:hypothetical protein
MMCYQNKISEPPSSFPRNLYVDTASSSVGLDGADADA